MANKESKIENRFTKEQVLASKKLNYSKDLFNAILSDGETYTLKEVETEIKSFLERKVE